MASTAARLRAALGIATLAVCAGCAAPVAANDATTPTPAASGPPTPPPIEVAAGVYMVPGQGGETSPANLGRLGNTGFIVGDAGVIAIDTGVSYQHGVALLAAIAQVTDRPVRLALVTHTRQEFLFGAAAFRERGIPVHMHRRAAALMASRCEVCLKNLTRTLGAPAMAGTVMWKPDAVFDADHDLGLAGRPVRVLYHGHSSGPGDVAVLDVRTGTLFAGGLVSWQRIPDVSDSDLPGWRHALDALQALGPARLVPGHGPLTDARALPVLRRYLDALESRLAQLLDAGAPLSEVPDRAALPEFHHWDQYDTLHRRNASVVFVRLERDLLMK